MKHWIIGFSNQTPGKRTNQKAGYKKKHYIVYKQQTNKQTNVLLSIKTPTMNSIINKNHTRCIFITTPFWLNRRSCLLSESGNASFRAYVQTTCISNWLIWKQKVCKTFLRSSRNISIIIVTQNSLKRVSWPIFWTKSVTL